MPDACWSSAHFVLLACGEVVIVPQTILYAAINGTFSMVWNRGAISVLMVRRWVVGSSSRHRSMV